MKKRDFHKYLIALAVIYVVRDIIQFLNAQQSSSSSRPPGSREKQPLLEQQVNKEFNKQVRRGWTEQSGSKVCC